MVCREWERALEVDGVDPDDDFFQLGGHSLVLVELAEALEQASGVTVPLMLFFEQPTPRAVANFIDASRGRSAL